MVYVPYLQNSLKRQRIVITFELRTSANPLILAETIRKAESKAAPRVPASEMRKQTQQIDNTIVAGANICGFVLSVRTVEAGNCVRGLYSTTAYAVARRC